MKVFVLERPGPLPARISAWSAGGEVRVYTESVDWEASPALVRVETMLHEMYHVAQYYRARGEQTYPQWLVEGSAVWAAATAAARHGVFPSYEAALGSFSLDAEPSSLRRAETQEGWKRLHRPYALSVRATEVLLEGGGGMRRLDEYWRLLWEHNVGSYRIAGGTVEWKRAFREAFGIRVSRFYARVDRVL